MDPYRTSTLFPAIAAQLRAELGTLHLAARQAIPPETREKDPELDRRAAVMDQSYYRLLRLVNLLSAASVSPEDTPLSLRNCDLVELIGDICGRAGDLAQLLGLEVRFSCAAPRHVCAVDPQQLEQLLFHLLSNAFKFTPSGGSVMVDLKFQPGRVILSVADTGQGIPPERRATLFDGCLRVQDPAPHGLGLGLLLCLRIASRHEGRLMVESDPGKGTCFTLSLPDRQVECTISDIPIDYTGGFNCTLLALADAMPAEAFLIRGQD